MSRDRPDECVQLIKQTRHSGAQVMVMRAKSGRDRTFARLSDILQNGMDIHRCAAATALGKMDFPGSSAVLTKALLDEDEDVRVDAVTALLDLDDSKTADAVMENLLGDPCPEVKLSAIEMLANVNHTDVVPWLHKIIAGRDEEINWDEDEFYATGWDDWLDIQLAAIKALGKIGTDESVAVILEAIANEEGQDVTQFAIPALAQLGGAGASALASLFDEGDARTRRRVCSVLQPGHSEEMDELLELCLADEAGDVRYVAVSRLIENNPDDERLAEFFEDPHDEVRILITKTVGAKEPAMAMARLSDKSPEVRQTVFRTIVDNPEAFEKEDFSEVVRKAIVGVPEVAAAAAVAWAALIGKPSAKSLGGALLNLEQPLVFRLGLIEALSLLEDAGLPYLVDTVGDTNRQVRISTLSALAQIATSDTWPNSASDSLLAALKGELVEPVEEVDGEDEDEGEDEDINVAESVDQSEATSTLDQILQDGIRTGSLQEEQPEEEEIVLTDEDKKFIELSKLRAIKKSKVSLDVKVAPHLDVRQFAARLLGDFDCRGLTKALGKALEDDDIELKQSCLESLALIGAKRGKLKKRLFPAIQKATQHEDRLVRMLGTRCLAFIKGAQVKEALITLCQDEDVHVRRQAVTSLGRKEGHIETLLSALDDEYSGVRTAGARALCLWHEHMDVLIELTLAHDGMHRQEIVTLLKDWNANEAGEKYLDILEDESKKRVWLVAIAALSELFSPSTDEDIQVAA